MGNPSEPKLLLVASSGGHLLELSELIGDECRRGREWVTFDKPDARSLLADERVWFAHGPTNRSIVKLLRNAVLALRLVRHLRPDAVISTGAGVGVPFLYAARAFGRKAIYVESLARIDDISLSGRLVYPVASEFFVQWPELAHRRRRARYAGAVL